jgi:hypothetical protein
VREAKERVVRGEVTQCHFPVYIYTNVPVASERGKLRASVACGYGGNGSGVLSTVDVCPV